MIADYLHARETVPFRVVALGYRSVILHTEEELQYAQHGYSIGDGGTPLTGDTPGDWRKNWLVIGYEDECGDPIFIDSTRRELPVYTARHGEGDWVPTLIATSFANFIKALTYVKDLSIGRENPADREANPVPSSERDALLEAIFQENPDASLEFWQTWLDV